jgi:small-conductance mechanosensitive channel
MNTFFKYLIIFFYYLSTNCSFINFEKNEQQESSNSNQTTISEYRNFLEKFGNPKEKIEKIRININKRIKDKNSYIYISAVRKLQEIYIELDYIKNEMEKLIKEYEKIIDSFFNNKLFQEEKDISSEKISFETVKKYSLKIGFLIDSIDSIENKIKEINKEKKEKEESLKRFYLNNTADKDIDKYLKDNKIEIAQKQLNDGNLKLKELELYVLETKKSILKEELKSVRNIFNKFKQNIVLTEKYMKDFIFSQKKLQKTLFEEKDILLKDLDNINIEILKIKNDYDDSLIEKTIEIIKNLILTKNINNYDILIKNLNLFHILIEKEILNIKINIIHFKNLFSQKIIFIMEGWNFCSKNNASVKEIKNIISNIDIYEIKNILNDFTEKKNNILEMIHSQSFLITSLKELVLNSKDLETVFNKINEKHNQLINISKEQSDIVFKIRDLFFITIPLNEELKAKSFWGRSKFSITLNEIKNFYPDIKEFYFNVKNGFFPFINQIYLFLKMEKILSLSQIIYMIISILICILIGFLYKYYIPQIYSYIIRNSLNLSFLNKFGIFINFFIEQGLLLYSWISIFVLFKLKLIPSEYAGTIFFLLSIIYIFFVIKNFLNWFEKINRQRSFIFISADYSKRFIFILGFFCYLSSFIYLMREAFLKTGPLNSPVPTILLAIQFILFQIFLISLLKKEQVLNIIPEREGINSFLKDLLNNYYQIFFTIIITIIIMSNPYVGYGKQVLYLLSRTILTIVILPIFNKLFDFFKSKSIYIIFNIYDGEIKNKIPAGKIIYTLLNCFVFIAFCIIFYIFLCFIWGVEMNLKNIFDFFSKNLLDQNNLMRNEKIVSFSILDFFKVIFFFGGGYIIAYFFNLLVSSKILNPIIIGTALQSSIMTLIKYLIILCSFIVGLYSAGLQSITTKIAFIIGALGFAMKEPFADFFSYFIILIQRPIKIGDLIKLNRIPGGSGIDVEIIGIVRQITPRTTLIRQRNSNIVIIPNSIIVTRMISNWNFSKTGFIGTDDIIIHVEIENDPEQIRIIIQKALETHPFILKNPSPIIRCDQINSLGYEFLIRPYISVDRAIDQWDIASQIRILIVKKLKSENISISIPKHNIKIDK